MESGALSPSRQAGAGTTRMRVSVQLAGRRTPLVVELPQWCETLQDVADALVRKLEAGTWIQLEHDDVEAMMPLYTMARAGSGSFHRFFLAPGSPAGGGSGDDKDGPQLMQVRERRRLGHLPPLAAVPAAPYRLGVGRLIVHAWPPAHQYLLVDCGDGLPAVELPVQQGTRVAELKAMLLSSSLGLALGERFELLAHNPGSDVSSAEQEVLLLPQAATLCQLGITPAWSLQLVHGALGDPLTVNVNLLNGYTKAMHATSGMKAAHLKQQLVAAAGVPARAMRLSLRGRTLQDPDPLSKYLHKGDTAQLSLLNSMTTYRSGRPFPDIRAVLRGTPEIVAALKASHRLVEIVHPCGSIDVATCPEETTFAQLKAALQAHWSSSQASSQEGQVRLVTLALWQQEQQAQQGEALAQRLAQRAQQQEAQEAQQQGQQREEEGQQQHSEEEEEEQLQQEEQQQVELQYSWPAGVRNDFSAAELAVMPAAHAAAAGGARTAAGSGLTPAEQLSIAAAARGVGAAGAPMAGGGAGAAAVGPPPTAESEEMPGWHLPSDLCSTSTTHSVPWSDTPAGSARSRGRTPQCNGCSPVYSTSPVYSRYSLTSSRASSSGSSRHTSPTSSRSRHTSPTSSRSRHTSPTSSRSMSRSRSGAATVCPDPMRNLLLLPPVDLSRPPSQETAPFEARPDEQDSVPPAPATAGPATLAPQAAAEEPEGVAGAHSAASVADGLSATAAATGAAAAGAAALVADGVGLPAAAMGAAAAPATAAAAAPVLAGEDPMVAATADAAPAANGVAAAAKAATGAPAMAAPAAAVGDAVEAATALAAQLSSMAAAAAAAAAAVNAAGPPKPAALQSSLAAAQQLMAALAPAAQACSALLAHAAAAAAVQAAARPAAATAEVAVQTEQIEAAKQCGNCGAGREQLGRTQKLLRCPCKSVYYCSSACQKEDWPSHKRDCRMLQKLLCPETSNGAAECGADRTASA